MQLTTVVNDFPATSLVPPVMQSLTFERAVVFARTIQQRMDQDALREQQEESIMPFVAAAGNQSTKRQHAEVEYSITGVHDTPVQRFPDKHKKQKSSSNEKRKQPGAPNGSPPKQCLMHRQSITHSTDECTTLIRMREQLSQAPHAARFSEKPCKGCGAVEHAFKDCFLARVPNNSSNEAGPGKLPESVKDLSSITGSLIAPFLTAVGCLIQQAKGPVISSSSGPLIVEPRIHSIDGQRVRCFIDTGCTNMSFITKRLCSELNLKIHQDINVTQILADNTARQALGVTDEFCLYYNNKARTLRAVVVEEMLFTDLTLGCDDSVQLGIVTITTENPLQGTDPGFLTELEHLHDTSMKMLEEEADADAGAKVEAAIHDLMEINQKVKGFADVPPIKLNLSTDEPIYIPQYPISNKEDVKLQITKWLATGKIRICQPGETRNNLPLTTAGKFDNQGRRVGTRICLDPRAVNKITAKSDYPIPTVRNVIDSLVGNKYFTELDLEDAFLQIRLSEEDQKTLVFTFEGVTYAFIGSPYGLHFMTSEFQRRLTAALHGIDAARPYVDNINIASRTLEEHIVHVRQTIQRLNQYNFKISAKKTKLARTTIDVLGLRVSSAGVAPDPAKVANILKWPFPETHKALLCFLGVVNYMRTHIRHITELCEPLNKARASPRDFAREISTNKQAMVEACERIKQALASAPILRWPNKNLKFHIATDGSRVGIGAVLFQPSEEQIARGDFSITPDNIVMFASRALKHNERNYSTYKLEALALVYAVDSFHHLIFGQEFVVHTDHSALLHLREYSEQQRTLGSWLLRLNEYQFTIQHVKGEFNVLPDCLSRLYAKSAAWGVPQERGKPATKPLVKLDANVIQPVLDQFQQHMNKINQDDSISAPFAARHIAKQTASEKEELIKMTGRTIPTESERSVLITATHERGHYGAPAMLADLFHEQRFWWPNMGKEIQAHVLGCEECQRWNAANTGYHPLKSPSVGLPGDYWQVDILSLPQTTAGHNYALIVLDLFTGFCIGRALRTKSASEVAHHLYQIISEWGPPRILHTDEGSEFLNAILSELTNIYKVQQKIAPAYNHRSIGAVERLNRTIRNSLHKMLKGALGSWDLILPRVIFFYNTTVRSTSNSTPYALMFGRMSNLHAPMLNASELTFDANAWLQSQRTLFESIYPAIKEVIDRKHEKANDKFNQKHHMVDELAPGTKVAVKELVRGSKSNPPFLTGNFTVKGKDPTNGAYLVV